MTVGNSLKTAANVLFILGFVCFFLFWLFAGVQLVITYESGGKPHAADHELGKYYLREKHHITEVTEATFKRVAWWHDSWKKHGLIPGYAAIACMISGGLLRVTSRRWEAKGGTERPETE